MIGIPDIHFQFLQRLALTKYAWDFLQPSNISTIIHPIFQGKMP